MGSILKRLFKNKFNRKYVEPNNPVYTSFLTDIIDMEHLGFLTFLSLTINVPRIVQNHYCASFLGINHIIDTPLIGRSKHSLIVYTIDGEELMCRDGDFYHALMVDGVVHIIEISGKSKKSGNVLSVLSLTGVPNSMFKNIEEALEQINRIKIETDAKEDILSAPQSFSTHTLPHHNRSD